MSHALAVRISERYLQADSTQAKLSYSLPFLFELYTFGAQRMCNKAFQRWTRDLVLRVPRVTAFRFADEYDIIPQSPTHVSGFRHGGGQLITFMDKKRELGDSIRNHLMGTYRDRIAAISKAELGVFNAFDSDKK